MSINSEFKVQIVTTNDEGNETTIAPALSAAITGFEREVNDEEEADNGFMVSGSDDSDDHDSNDGEDESEPDDEEQKPDAVLYLSTSVSKEVTNDLAVLRDLAEIVKIRFTFGDNVLVREFEVDSEMWVILNECERSPENLQILVCFDIYDSATRF